MQELDFLKRLKIKISKENVVGMDSSHSYQRTTVELFYADDEDRDILLSSDFIDEELKIQTFYY